MKGDELAIFGAAIERQAKYVESWRKPSEPLLFETLRAIDHLFMRELLDPVPRTGHEPLQHSISSWGTNKALERIVPPLLARGPFRLFRSTSETQSQADEFLFQCGVLQRAELLHAWLREGLLTARLDTPSKTLPSGTKSILVLKTADASLFSEIVGHQHREWMGDLTVRVESARERELEQRHVDMLPALEQRVRELDGWTMTYSTNREIDDYFMEWAQLYLRRMWSGDLLGTEDNIGGCQFNEYLGVLAALSGRAQKHLCFTSLIKQRHPHLDFRNLLTTFVPCDDFLTSLAAHLDADTLHVQKLLSSLTLEHSNLTTHTSRGETAWAPIIRSSADFYLLPQYGLDINPFLFLLRDLEGKYPLDWARLANNRERRWIDQLTKIFPPPRWTVHTNNLRLRHRGTVVTDLDFVAYDTESNEFGLFQLKWQQPAWHDNRARRSAGKNLVSEGNKWTASVLDWLSNYGVAELAKRTGIAAKADARAELFVIARYNAFFSGYSNRSSRATWADWNHLLKARLERPRSTMSELASVLVEQTTNIVSSHRGEAYALPLGDMAVVLNPSSEPRP